MDTGAIQSRPNTPTPAALPVVKSREFTNIFIDAVAFGASFVLMVPLFFVIISSLISHAPAARAQKAATQAKPASQTASSAIVKNSSHPVDMVAVQNTLSQFAASAGAPYGIVVINLKDGATANVNANNSFISASLYKLFVALAVYKGIDSGSINSGGATGHGVNTSVADCLNNMITWSDNTCGVALGSLIGWERQNASMHNAGYTSTFLQSNDDEKTSAGDVALLLKRLYDGTLLSPNSTQAFIGLLTAQQINDRLPVGLPAGVKIAHKTGDLDGYVHDAGIVYGKSGDYVIAAMSGPWATPGNAPSSFASLSSKVYSSLNP
jgi:beta-lactamase class A